MTTGKILPIVGYGSPILREVCLEVEQSIDKVELLANDLVTTMLNIGTAVGLAAPQINSNLRMFVMKVERGIKPIVVINPVIKKGRMEVRSDEGCLSIPGVNATVPNRHEVINVEYYDEKLNKQSVKLRGFDAIVFQHEFDHLNGILYTDRLTKEGTEAVKDKLSDIEKGLYKSSSYEMIFPNNPHIQV